MQAPPIDVMLLPLLVLVFGVQQRSRPQTIYRFWFVGWVLIVATLGMWSLSAHGERGPAWDAARWDVAFGGAFAFLLSFVTMKGRVWRPVLLALIPVSILSAMVDAELVRGTRFELLAAAGQVTGILVSCFILPRAWLGRRIAIWAICAVYGVGMLALRDDPRGLLPSLVFSEMLVATAVLYACQGERLDLQRVLGAVGFGAWALVQVVPVWMPETSRWAGVLGSYWNLPKDLVGFAMVLQVFEDARGDVARIAQAYKNLYGDFRLVYDQHPYPMFMCDPGTERILSANAVAGKTYGYPEHELLGMHLPGLEVGADAEVQALDELLAPSPDGRRARHRLKNGKVIWVNVVEHEITFQGRAARLVMAQDITERMKMNQDLAFRAHHDPLTALPNRLLLSDRMKQCLSRSEREGRKAVLLTIDIDHFKRINDTYGHAVGDEVLKVVAARLASKIRQIDTIARVGGEEFAAIIGGLSCMADAQKIAVSLLRQFEAPIELAALDLSLTVSIGGAMYPDDGLDAATLHELSDQALYHAKRTGRNRAAFASTLGTARMSSEKVPA